MKLDWRLFSQKWGKKGTRKYRSSTREKVHLLAYLFELPNGPVDSQRIGGDAGDTVGWVAQLPQRGAGTRCAAAVVMQMMAAVSRAGGLRLRALPDDSGRRRRRQQNGGRRLRRSDALPRCGTTQRVWLAALARTAAGRRRWHQVTGDRGGRVANAAGRRRAPIVLHLEVRHRAHAAVLDADVRPGTLVAGAHHAGRTQHRRHRRWQQRRRALLPHQHGLHRARWLRQQAGSLIAAVVEVGRWKKVWNGGRRLTRDSGHDGARVGSRSSLVTASLSENSKEYRTN